jgi:hypothetical protein
MTPLLVMLTLHFIGDFLLQSDWMALNKSKNWDALSQHVLVYALTIGVGFGWYTSLDFTTAVDMTCLVFTMHILTDAITSRITARLYAAKQNHWFFVVIGFDQLLHAFQLAAAIQFVNR